MFLLSKRQAAVDGVQMSRIPKECAIVLAMSIDFHLTRIYCVPRTVSDAQELLWK